MCVTNSAAARRARTHQAIADAAALLFAEHGFSAVTIDEVAAAAGVARQTVFNHFAVKEDLVFDEIEEQRAALLAAIRNRPAGSSAVAAVQDQIIARWKTVRTVPDDGRPDSGIFRLVHHSPTLRARQLQLNAGTVDILAPALGIEEPMIATVIATALVAVEQALFDRMAAHVVAGGAVEDVRDDLLAQARRAFDRIGTQ